MNQKKISEEELAKLIEISLLENLRKKEKKLYKAQLRKIYKFKLVIKKSVNSDFIHFN